ncbi:MAG: family 10 glycosylhydrolase [Candidatus Marinimicrobia bacterium]|jgi:uncharacterized lipoprotein YddW (UPF0748 family)|nr:family 10 glycosylhydrolase [Candidatus Neomarinimicrobiota bacterium]MBT3630056.1 family 10 glycosylhydrolase [Candidatus Neomarinimicrobiota bacterium]MBT3824223.1 family 10 glycosylhydrolase [Candidatus Neomarinimicrobiota bacterium]MBT4130156.1 family 10 glycosylhydrolase [Candidatus Neomarinimicrobiota bacterium]MBT4295495.1 family 10 glycosylhydrolase [Candidatus Neomarinimicrobiota bacterium]
MKKKLIAIATILLLGQQIVAQTTNDEWRATWVITWEHISSGSTIAQNQARVRQILDNHVDANMNAVLWQARQGGTAYYNSSFEPWGYYAGGSDPGYDPLEYAIEQAHSRGLELHAWFNTFQAASTAPGTPAGDHPEWVCRDQSNIAMPSSRALSPGLPEVRDYLVDVAMEIVNNYDIDGIHLDYVRWNEYSDLALRQQALDPIEEISQLDQVPNEAMLLNLLDPQSGRYLYDVDHPYSGGIPAGYASWPEFWRTSVTTFVESLHDSIQTQKPWVRLSVAALGKYNWSGWNGYNIVYQDAAKWFNEGSIDQLTPMHYHWLTSVSFIGMLQGSCPDCWSEYIQPGINAGRLYTAGPGSYLLEDAWSNHVGIVNAVRNVNWVDGFQFFSYGSWRDFDYFEAAGIGMFSKKTKVRDTGLIVDATPATPAISLTQLDELNVQLDITTPAGLAEDQWFVVYRDAVNSIDQDQSTIIDVHFGQAGYTIVDAFDGTQDHNAEYYYATTMLDRYWNESLSSASVVSDVLPSYAPRVESIDPMEADTVSVVSIIDIMFTKTMNTTSVDSAIIFSPAVSIEDYVWSSEDHRLRLYVDGSYEFGTTYTMTIAETAVDINDVQLDGNGDGVAGDAYSVSFTTHGVDVTGPEIRSMYPDAAAGADSFDVMGVVSFTFDELLDPVTVNETSVTLWLGTQQVEADPVHSSNEFRSIIDVRAEEPLTAGETYSLHLDTTITDTAGNELDEEVIVSFVTQLRHYTESILIDDLRGTMGSWADPGYSGTTAGILGSQTEFNYTSAVYLPASYDYNSRKKSAYLKYAWDPEYDGGDGPYMIREYLSGGAARDIVFDNSYILQCFVYGDASGNRLRFALDEKIGVSWPNHEVSIYHVVDWEGWRLLEWDLTDPEQVGIWIGNELLDGSGYRIDSFQLSYDEESGDGSGQIHFDELRAVKKMPGVFIDRSIETQLPSEVSLYQNYPNPFNPETVISFDLPANMQTQISIFDIRGRELEVLVNDNLLAGKHTMRFNGSDYAAGVYMVVLKTELGTQAKRMLLLK